MISRFASIIQETTLDYIGTGWKNVTNFSDTILLLIVVQVYEIHEKSEKN